jgi:hypothetical protein
MEYIFDDEVGEIGSEVEAYCQKCRTEGPHTVITRYEDEVRQVQCATCGHVHAYKPIRPDPGDEDITETPAGRRRVPKKVSWEEAMRQLGTQRPRTYGFREAFRQGEYIDHPKFGRGYVSEVLDESKIEAVFRDGPRVLVHNRRDTSAADDGKRTASKTAGGRAKATGSRARPGPAKAKPAKKTRTRQARITKSLRRAAAKAKPRRKPPARTRRPAKPRRPAGRKSRR